MRPSRIELANAIRALSMDAVQKANSGHPGAPMGMADIAQVLWCDYLKHNPTDPNWVNRDRFVLSNGHGSMLIYALLHLTGYALGIDDLKNFRQLHSKTPGHPEYGYTPGVETTTGPLGQGLANAVGMAIAERALAAQFNQDQYEIVNHHTYVFLGDGCLMEGISHEACSLAGTLGLGKLIAFWDNNGISIDGPVTGWFTDDTPQRFSAYGWHVIKRLDGHQPDAISKAIKTAIAVTDKPTLICCKTTIGFGSPNKAGQASCHGAPLGAKEVELTKKALGWQHEPFVIPQAIYNGWDAKANGKKWQNQWDNQFANYAHQYPELAAEFERRLADQRPKQWSKTADRFIQQCHDKKENKATRNASLDAIECYATTLPELFGGSADLGGSNLTQWSGHHPMKPGQAMANYIHYGVREFAMAALMNGIALHGGLIPFGATFLVFSEYARNAIRMAALMKIRTIFVFTHDSIGLGEDGPTHQAIEQLPNLRTIPNMVVWRPCDSVESAVAWAKAIDRSDGPSCLVFSRQKVPHQSRSQSQVANIAKGGYILKDCNGLPEVIIIATGSEVGIAVEAAANSNKRVRVVSMPSTNQFDAQDSTYQETVLPTSVTARIAVEAATTDGWWRYVGSQGKVMGVDCFGESAPGDQLFTHFGLTAKRLSQVIDQMVG